MRCLFVINLTIDGEPWFVGKDVAKALGYGQGKSLNNAVANHVDSEDRGVTEMMTPGGRQNVGIINESGVYALIFGSKLPAAKKFKRWVRTQVVSREISMAELARQMNIPQSRISEAIHGKSSGNKYILPIIKKLGGSPEDFKEFLKAV